MFLTEMEQVVPWSELCGLLEPFYPKGESGRRAFGLERMLRIYCLQQWFNLSDPAAEEALYDSLSMRRFVGIDLGREPVPDETTICRFRHLLEQHDFGRRMFEAIHEHLERKGLRLSSGTIVDATIIHAPSSTKNEEKARDPDMHQTRKGNQWYFGMKAHLGVDRRSKVIHAVVATTANVHDSVALGDLLHGRSAMSGATRRIRARATSSRTGRRWPATAPTGVTGTAASSTRPSGQEPEEVQGALARRACHRRDQVEVRLHQGSLSWPRKERQPAVRHLRAHQPVHPAAPIQSRLERCPERATRP